MTGYRTPGDGRSDGAVVNVGHALARLQLGRYQVDNGVHDLADEPSLVDSATPPGVLTGRLHVRQEGLVTGLLIHTVLHALHTITTTTILMMMMMMMLIILIITILIMIIIIILIIIMMMIITIIMMITILIIIIIIIIKY